MIRAIIGVCAGLIAAMSALFLGLMLLMGLNPIPDSVETGNLDAMNAFIGTLRDGAYIIKAFTHIIVCFSSGLVASLVSKPYKFQAGIITALLAFMLVVFRDFRYVYPSAYVVTDLALSAIAGFIGVMIGGNR